MALVLMLPLKPTGFWSYATSDDTHSGGRLSQLRLGLAAALQQQIGREPIVHLFQDVKAIPAGSDWDDQIHNAIGDASFFIPIITPGFLQSEWCAREVLLFAERQQSLGRNDLIFPIYQIDVEDFSGIRQRELYDPTMLALLRRHQWTDFRELEFDAVDGPAVRQQLRRLAGGVRAALYREVARPRPKAVPKPRQEAPAVVRMPGATLTQTSPAYPSAMPEPAAHRMRGWMVLMSSVAVVLAGALTYQLSTQFGPLSSKSPTLPVPPVATAPLSGPTAAPPVDRQIHFTPRPAETALAGQPSPPAQTSPAQTNVVPAPQADELAAPARVVTSASDAPAYDNGTRDCDAICPRLVLIPKGEFTMGVPDAESRREGLEAADSRSKPAHLVTIGRRFYLSETPVTRGEYNQCVKAKKCKPADTPSFTQSDNDPVVNVSYDDAISYAGWLKSITGKDYRLPSETEWEYAARAGTETARYWGDDFDDRRGDTVPRARQGTMPVKTFPANKFGLYDMLGNVWQWTEDCWNDDYRGNQPSDERPRSSGGCWARVLRGGSWYSNPKLVRVAIRDRYNAGFRYAYTGFRVARNF
jgi:formylglycine-generating enzyme required for sulfatase activity